MPTWITLTDADVRLLEVEKTVMEGVVTSLTLQQCVDNASNFARSYVPPPRAASPQVPPEIVNDVVAIARVNYLDQEPSGSLLSDFRKKERDDAIAHLKDVAKGLVTVTAPDVPVDSTQHKSEVEGVNVPCRKVTRDTLGRL